MYAPNDFTIYLSEKSQPRVFSFHRKRLRKCLDGLKKHQHANGAGCGELKNATGFIDDIYSACTRVFCSYCSAMHTVDLYIRAKVGGVANHKCEVGRDVYTV